jgi:hypothetical protein
VDGGYGITAMINNAAVVGYRMLSLCQSVYGADVSTVKKTAIETVRKKQTW